MCKITIDTNIFEHLLNPQQNRDSHIDKLLNHLTSMKYMLLVDSTKKIANEYQQMIIPIILKKDETRAQLPILRYWMSPDIRHEEPLDRTDTLMQKIQKVIHERGEHADRAFVYVACKGDCSLITNDGVHILGRRDELLRKTKKFRDRNTAIVDSRQALQALTNQGNPA